MTGTNGPGDSLPVLRIVPVETLVPHEQHDDTRAGPLIQKMRENGVLKNPPIVILDEATSHLDSETEVLIQQALAEALHGRTSLVIAHRLSTIRAADQILVVQGGVVVEQGRHDDLLTGSGLYRDLYETQYAMT